MSSIINKIRVQLAENKKLRQSLKYAFGEILLVVVGILVAIQIDNWNSLRIENDQEKQALCSLKNDFIDTRESLQITLNRQSKMLNYSLKLINIMEQRRLEPNLDSLRIYFGEGTWSWYRSEPVTGAYGSLIATNKLGLIKNAELRRELAKFAAEIALGFEDHGESMSKVQELESIMSPYISDILPDGDRKFIGLSAKENIDMNSFHELIKNKSFLGTLITKTFVETVRKQWQQQLLQYVNHIIALIDKELDGIQCEDKELEK